jgi:2-methylisocitrate lyase-like PEP mutase family enzyme
VKARDPRQREHMALAVGVHDGLSAMLVERAGFDVLWLGSFEASAHLGVPDSNIITFAEMAAFVGQVRAASTLPIYVDGDNGYGSDATAVRALQMFERAGAAAMSIEDSAFPKRNSLRTDGSKALLDTAEMAQRLEKLHQAASTAMIIARTEALVVGLGEDEAVTRLHTYLDAGADAVFLQVNTASRDLLMPTLRRIQGLAPIVLAPTALPGVPAAEFAEVGVTTLMFANVVLRTVVAALSPVLDRLRESGRLADVSDVIADVTEVLELTGNHT